ncbi:unnamed protein product [Cuscuta europaea]|uniref:Transcription repressor n=1 Tax=Cuscuta europaea TaxID=41803 RepID=A0A9P1E587_CUSEU|nr:unnamed protein product [Cuscuta europaea]
MGRKMKFRYWPWYRCGNIYPKTLCFRAETQDIDDHTPVLSSSSSSDPYDDGDYVEDVIRGLRSERLLFGPGGGKSSKLMEEEEEDLEGVMDGEKGFVLKGSVEVETMASSNPFVDFRRSMEEMVEAHGFQDWCFLQELLGSYLRINGRSTHEYIVGAFLDLLVHLLGNEATHDDDDDDDAIVASLSSFTSSRSSSACGHWLLSSFSSSSSPSSIVPSFSSPLIPFCSTLNPTTTLLSFLEEGEDVGLRNP